MNMSLAQVQLAAPEQFVEVVYQSSRKDKHAVYSPTKGLAVLTGSNRYGFYRSGAHLLVLKHDAQATPDTFRVLAAPATGTESAEPVQTQSEAKADESAEPEADAPKKRASK